VFNTQGKVVGMLVMGFDDCSISIHVTLLKEFVKLVDQDSKKVDKRGKQPVGAGHDSKVS
jgi:predicted transcriptional regulator YheO